MSMSLTKRVGNNTVVLKDKNCQKIADRMYHLCQQTFHWASLMATHM
ncbi:hypothetical protein SC1083_0346 [Aggregatibacter actinomycetemcomitans serotype e str. SC1083]|uniref:Uncharacterized protein n=1 Tax=Aggregatibacter actinomycetemcomitans serotype e str. SC1083 TaxID=907488 RepID=G4A6A6_AGGAC|nr:hypothetical protein SC1083_0346 [Aggregatibacter actinomycetemcomitans serotype e str. SC1083]